MNIIIFGASGATGVHLVKQALAKGYTVSAFVRNAHKLRLQHPELSLIEGNVNDAALVKQAVSGHDAVLSALGANRIFQFDPLVVNGTTHIINAMTDLQVKRLIYLSALGVRATRQQAGFLIRALAPTVLKHEITGHELREKIIQHSALQWTIVRAAILTNGELTKNYRAQPGLQSYQFATRISRANVAHCMLAQLEQSRFFKKAVSIMP